MYNGAADAENSPSTLDVCYCEDKLLQPCQQGDCEADYDSGWPGIQVRPLAASRYRQMHSMDASAQKCNEARSRLQG